MILCHVCHILTVTVSEIRCIAINSAFFCCNGHHSQVISTDEIISLKLDT